MLVWFLSLSTCQISAAKGKAPPGFDATMNGWTKRQYLRCIAMPFSVTQVPCVMDLLSMRANLKHHFRAYGGWSYRKLLLSSLVNVCVDKAANMLVSCDFSSSESKVNPLVCGSGRASQTDRFSLCIAELVCYLPRRAGVVLQNQPDRRAGRAESSGMTDNSAQFDEMVPKPFSR